MSGAVKTPQSASGLWNRLTRPAKAVGAVTSVTELEDWIAAWLAPKLGVEAGAIDRDMPFTDYGLDSMIAVKMSGDLEDILHRPVSPSVAWEYPTIAEVAAHLMPSEPAA
jgi:acyl carrier protein